ncbi:T9SS type A sorting domain-containing protein [Flammeovirgaceae bacterium SG7u.111]|nr:T9SS type A sorting domain-containing protein [Flammeovirgaceae bacterium SG7u.132]WPO37652.1 T9SS type A sorting domain-containing protein [Flammeovirgaceae bacterium SG7u.111]
MQGFFVSPNKKIISPKHTLSYVHVLITLFILSLSGSLYAQQQITVDVSPKVSAAINGEKNLNRSKYFNLASSVDEISSKIKTQERFDYYFKELEMTVGRKFQIVRGEVNWGNSVKEDPTRTGWADTTYLKNKLVPNANDDNVADFLKTTWASNQNLAAHEGHNAYPSFMEQYTITDAHDQKFPTNNDAAAELLAYIFKYKYTDFKRPPFYELINEPHWKFWGDQRFIDHHLKAKAKFDEMGINTQIGGPCYSVGNFYKKEFGNLNQITDFIDRTNFSLDFYSFHTYDYMRWEDAENDFVGGVSSGLPEESVFDAIAAHTYNKYGKEFTFVGSEHGGYIPDGANRTYALDKLADQYFPGSGFLHEMEKRSIDNFIMVNSAIANTLMFMNHPHIVKKSVPFILLESAGWDPTYYSSLLVKENFDKNSDVWHEAKLIHFFNFFDDVKGRRVESYTSDTDIQHFTFVDKNVMTMLFHNQSNTEGTINVNVDNDGNSISKIKIRRLGRGEDFRPNLAEGEISTLQNINIGAQESIVVFVTYDADIEEETEVNEIPYYSSETGVKFNGSKSFTVQVPEYQKAKYAILRVGVSRDKANGKEIEISLNGTKLASPVEDCAERITNDDYATTRIIKVDGKLLKELNTVEVKFPDGKSGGVGAVVIRAGIDDDIVAGLPAELVENLKIYPNPAKDFVNIQSEFEENLELISIEGKILKEMPLNFGATRVPLDGLGQGLYILRLSNANRYQAFKLKVTK